MEQWISGKEVCKLMSISPKTLRRRVKKYGLPKRVSGDKRFIFIESSVQDVLAHGFTDKNQIGDTVKA